MGKSRWVTDLLMMHLSYSDTKVALYLFDEALEQNSMEVRSSYEKLKSVLRLSKTSVMRSINVLVDRKVLTHRGTVDGETSFLLKEVPSMGQVPPVGPVPSMGPNKPRKRKRKPKEVPPMGPSPTHGTTSVDRDLVKQESINLGSIPGEDSVYTKNTLPVKEKKKQESVLLAEFFIEKCEELKGFKPVINWPKAMTLANRVIKSIGYEEALNTVTHFLESDKSDRCGTTLSIALSSHSINSYLASKTTKGDIDHERRRFKRALGIRSVSDPVPGNVHQDKTERLRVIGMASTSCKVPPLESRIAVGLQRPDEQPGVSVPGSVETGRTECSIASAAKRKE